MQYALVEGLRSEARKGLRGTCEGCQAPVIAKCGTRVIHHWAHANRLDCDPWWENETPWHREWKARFPERCREVVHFAPDGELHRADVVTSTGIVVEIQNSPMGDGERRSREAFYGNLVWIVNGASFRDHFHILHQLPDPEAEVAADIVWHKAQYRPGRDNNWGAFWRRSENPNVGPRDLVLTHGLHRFEEVLESYCGHHQYDWKRPRAGWLDAGCPVYLDFGDECLWQLMSYGEQQLPCVRAVAKAKFVHDAMTETRAVDIATRFYPIARTASDEPAR